MEPGQKENMDMTSGSRASETDAAKIEGLIGSAATPPGLCVKDDMKISQPLSLCACVEICYRLGM